MSAGKATALHIASNKSCSILGNPGFLHTYTHTWVHLGINLGGGEGDGLSLRYLNGIATFIHN